MSGRLLGIDYGSKRIGVAISDELGCVARPLQVIASKGLSADVAAVVRVVREQEVVRVVVGMPYRLDGSVGWAAEKAQAFVDALRAALDPLPVGTRDEALTTWAADSMLKEQGQGPRERRKHVDAYAAAVILQEELDHPGAGPDRPSDVRDPGEEGS